MRDLLTPDNPTPRLHFPAWRRIRSSADFERIYALKQRAADSRLLIFGCINNLEWTRIGLSVSRKHGNSVVRHRLRRLLKEAYRLSQKEIPEGLDLILIPQAGCDSDLDDFRDSLRRLSRTLWTRIVESNSTQ